MSITVETQTEIVQMSALRRQAEEADAEVPYHLGVLSQKRPRSTIQRRRAL
jgi:hypothetical protein